MDQSLAQQIEAREAEWTTAYNANDAERLSAIYEDDAVFIAPGMPPLRGRAEIKTVLPNFFAGLRNLTLIVDEIRAVGEDHAVVVGHSTQQELQEDGSWKDSVNNYQVLYHRGSDGEWYYATDMFNHR